MGDLEKQKFWVLSVGLAIMITAINAWQAARLSSFRSDPGPVEVTPAPPKLKVEVHQRAYTPEESEPRRGENGYREASPIFTSAVNGAEYQYGYFDVTADNVLTEYGMADWNVVAVPANAVAYTWFVDRNPIRHVGTLDSSTGYLIKKEGRSGSLGIHLDANQPTTRFYFCSYKDDPPPGNWKDVAMGLVK